MSEITFLVIIFNLISTSGGAGSSVSTFMEATVQQHGQASASVQQHGQVNTIIQQLECVIQPGNWHLSH